MNLAAAADLLEFGANVVRFGVPWSFGRYGPPPR